jgi:hypothetical protein
VTSNYEHTFSESYQSSNTLDNKQQTVKYPHKVPQFKISPHLDFSFDDKDGNTDITLPPFMVPASFIQLHGAWSSQKDSIYVFKKCLQVPNSMGQNPCKKNIVPTTKILRSITSYTIIRHSNLPCPQLHVLLVEDPL